MPILHWLDRDKHVRAAEEVPYRLLQVEEAHGAGEADSPNMLVQGDNLEALKALLPYYAGRVMCVFIDPPYNTRSAFTHYDDNLEHSQWLAMMFPRLQLLRELLAEDGSIWVTIDDHEAHYLKVVMDEVFGRRNFLTTFIWKKAYGGGAKSKWFVGLHEYAHCYAKNLEIFPDMFLSPDPEAESKYYKLTDEKVATRGPFRVKPLEATKSMDRRENLVFSILAPDGKEVWPKRQWWWSKDRVENALKNNDLYFMKAKDGTWSIQYKQYLRDEEGNERLRKPTSIIDGPYTQDGTKESIALFGNENKFAYPKPEGVLKTIIEASTKSGDLVLDSFLGSGTTAAVAHKMGRRWIGVEMGGHAVTHCVPRLKKVIAGEQGGVSAAVGWRGGGGFRFYKLGATVFDTEGRINPDIRFAHLAAHIWFSETHVALPKKPTRPWLGVHDGTAYYLLYNGILGDRRPDGGNVLTGKVLAQLTPHDGPKVIYGEACRLGPARLKALGVVFKQTPYDIKAR